MYPLLSLLSKPDRSPLLADEVNMKSEPTVALYTRAYAATLRSLIDESHVRHVNRPANLTPAVDPAPLIDRLRRLTASLPDDLRRQALPIEFFAERLKGRNRPTPHRGELARCLRQLGYARTRQWRKNSIGFRALWHPPALEI